MHLDAAAGRAHAGGPQGQWVLEVGELRVVGGQAEVLGPQRRAQVARQRAGERDRRARGARLGLERPAQVAVARDHEAAAEKLRAVELAAQERLAEVEAEAATQVEATRTRAAAIEEQAAARIATVQAESATQLEAVRAEAQATAARAEQRAQERVAAAEDEIARIRAEAGSTVDEQVATQMAQGARRALGVDLALATTGVAGPGPSEGHPAGTVWLACASPSGLRTRRLALTGERPAVRAGAVQAALDLARAALLSVGGDTPDR